MVKQLGFYFLSQLIKATLSTLFKVLSLFTFKEFIPPKAQILVFQFSVIRLNFKGNSILLIEKEYKDIMTNYRLG